MYSEVFTPCFMPLVFFIPNFHKYGIHINEGNTNSKEGIDTTITFGYGWAGPSGITSHTACIKNIDPSSVITGTATGKENLLKFGGWGIRYSITSNTWAYNARNGQYVEFEEIVDTKTTRYRIASENADKVASILRGKTST